jgi:hypothetical protein
LFKNFCDSKIRPAKDKENIALANGDFDVIGAARLSDGVVDLGAYESDWTTPIPLSIFAF